MAGINPVKAHQWHISEDAESTAVMAAEFLCRTIQQVLQHKSECLIALPGGNTPVKCLQHLSRTNLPWSKCHWFLGDERCYPLGHEERNDTMILQSFLSHIDYPHDHFHPIAAELPAETAAEQYSQLLLQFGPLDIAFLGMGEDGHTASLFPDNPALASNTPAVAVYNSPKPPAQRISLSRPTLLAARTRMVLVTGAGKRQVIAQIKQGSDLPINSIGPIHWFIDRAAQSQ